MFDEGTRRLKRGQDVVVGAIQTKGSQDLEELICGVEVIPPILRDGKNFYSLRDLRNGNLVKNVTPTSARRLWHYAISRYAEIHDSLDKEYITWIGDFGLIHQDNQGKTPHFDLIQKTSNGYRFFFGVTPDGIHGPWKQFFAEDEVS